MLRNSDVGDRAVGLAGRRQVADLPLARSERVRAVDCLAPRPRTGGDELAPRPLGQRQRAGGRRRREREPQRLARLDPPAESHERAAELDLERGPDKDRRPAEALERRGGQHGSPAGVRLADTAGVPGPRQVGRAARCGDRGIGDGDRLPAAAEMRERERRDHEVAGRTRCGERRVVVALGERQARRDRAVADGLCEAGRDEVARLRDLAALDQHERE